ncbi:MAG: ABC transporter ATP-binding protein, partial [Solimonas sp.]
MQTYLETVIAREDHAKEVKLFGLGPLLLGRYQAIYDKLYHEERNLAVRRDGWGFGLGLIGVCAYYGAYAWVAISTVTARITLGQMTMYLALFRNGQGAVTSILSAISGMYEDNLYLSTLYEYLETPVTPPQGVAQKGPSPQDGIRFEHVHFRYPDAEADALHDIDLHIRPGESLALVGENGAGKTTLIKLLTRLYAPTRGRILLDGLDLQDWNEDALRARIGVIFQDFARYQFMVGENIGVGDVRHFDDEARWQEAADKGMAAPFVEALPQKFHTQLGKWFREGRELSGGQWQKVALSRAFMRTQADVLVLDEPTSAMDAGAEAEIFAHFRALMEDRIAILISHRFSTVRMADQIVVVDNGRIVERGNHAELMQVGGIYAHLFSLQARGYQ